MTTILQICPLSAALDARLREQFKVLSWWEMGSLAELAASDLSAITGIATSAGVGVPSNLMRSLPNLAVISSRGVGMDQLDLALARELGIQVAGTQGVLDDCVADLAFGLLIDAARRITAADCFVRRGDWLQARYPLACRVSGKRLGIAGLGRIGKTIAQRAAGFNMPVGYFSRHRVAGCDYPYFDSVAALARWADFLMVAVPGGRDTHHLISRQVLDALGPDGYLINIARGSVVDQAALAEALRERAIAGAALDVFEDEPRVPESLIALDNVVLTPHCASGTRETRQAMEDLVLANLQAFYDGDKVLTPAI